jgi:gamma-glutamylcyclotransferase (GGCT)/AIG2-like uncharacterized protein YtfP
MGSILYFAYGSNLSTRQMRSRCATARVEGRAVLRNYALAFGGFSARWGGPVATIVPVRGAEVDGLLYMLQEADLRSLDRHEGYPLAYLRTKLVVTDERGRHRRAVVYVQTVGGDRERVPSARYVRVLRRAYERLGFDLSRLASAVGRARQPTPRATLRSGTRAQVEAFASSQGCLPFGEPPRKATGQDDDERAVSQVSEIVRPKLAVVIDVDPAEDA